MAVPRKVQNRAERARSGPERRSLLPKGLHRGIPWIGRPRGTGARRALSLGGHHVDSTQRRRRGRGYVMAVYQEGKTPLKGSGQILRVGSPMYTTIKEALEKDPKGAPWDLLTLKRQHLRQMQQG